jgi:hypothetical protein
MKKNMCRKGISRRDFLKLTAAAACLSLIPPFPKKISAQTPGNNELFWVTNIPETMNNGNFHSGIDGLLNLMGNNGLKFYRSPDESNESGPLGMIASNDVVLIKVNAQWKYRGCTNSDLIRGLIQRILDHPDGFTGEIVIFENGQGRGSLQCDTMGGDYPTGVHANAEDESHSFTYLVDAIFNDPKVSYYLLDPISGTIINSDNHTTNGYRTYENVSFPCFTTTGGHRVELREGIWNGSGYSQNLKLINVPVLKHHDTEGSEITASLKHFYGVLSMADQLGQSGFRHYVGLGETCGKMVASIRTPVLNIIDAIWVSQGSLGGYPKATTTRINQIIASQDPVALDHWAAKYILYPINGNQRHHPDFPGIASWLSSAAITINGRGGLFNPNNGIFIQNVTKDESKMVSYELAIAPSSFVFSPPEGTIGTEVTITGSDLGHKAGKVLMGGLATKIVSWNDTSIRCIVKKMLLTGRFHVTIQPQPYRSTSPKLITSAFTIKNPEMDPLSTDHGSPGDEITIPGRFFSARKGKVYIEYEKDGQPRRVMCPVKSWVMDPLTGASEIRFQVPKIKYSGPCVLIIANKAGTVETTFTISSSF